MSRPLHELHADIRALSDGERAELLALVRHEEARAAVLRLITARWKRQSVDTMADCKIAADAFKTLYDRLRDGVIDGTVDAEGSEWHAVVKTRERRHIALRDAQRLLDDVTFDELVTVNEQVYVTLVRNDQTGGPSDEQQRGSRIAGRHTDMSRCGGTSRPQEMSLTRKPLTPTPGRWLLDRASPRGCENREMAAARLASVRARDRQPVVS